MGVDANASSERAMAASMLEFLEIYLWIGGAVAALFLTIGVGRVDEPARGAYAFRPLLAPGVIGLWPLVLWRWAAIELKRLGQGSAPK